MPFMTETKPGHFSQEIREAVWRHVELARNVHRPHTLELVRMMSESRSVIELGGDRLFGEDPAMVGGFATLGRHKIVFVGHQKSDDVYKMQQVNFGMAHPEGYRKAIRIFKLGERFGLPVVTFIDTPGAAPGAGAEERGIAESIARSISTMSSLKTPIVAVIIGEGGSGGALGIGVGDRVLALENSIYSVISPEGCAQILWRSTEARKEAAVAMKLTAGDQEAIGVVDHVILEPDGGAHNDHFETARRLKAAITEELDDLTTKDTKELVNERYTRYRNMGAFIDKSATLTHQRAKKREIAKRFRGLIHRKHSKS